MQILNLRLIYIFFLHAFFCFWIAEKEPVIEVVNYMFAGSGLFWVGRTIEQFVYIRLLPLKNPINVLLLVMFVIGIAIYTIPLIYSV